MEQPLSNPPSPGAGSSKSESATGESRRFNGGIDTYSGIWGEDPPEGNSDLEKWANEFYEWSTRIPDLIPRINIYTSTINPSSVAANITAEQTFTVNGLQTSDVVVTVEKPSLTAGLGIVGSRVSADNTLAITFINATAAAIDAGSETYSIITIRN